MLRSYLGAQRRWLRPLALVTVGVAALYLLSGCVAVSRISAGIADGRVKFVLCEDISPNKVVVSVSPIKSDADGKTVWVTHGSKPLKQGDVVRYGIDPAGYSTTTGPRSFDLTRSTIGVKFLVTAPQKQTGGVPADFDGNDLVAGKWLNWNGDLVAKPCDG